MMQLDTWMTREGMSDAKLANALNRRGVACDRTSVSRWRRRIRRPEWPAIEALKVLSHGAVTADSFTELERAQ